jgi:hypothetical protein
MKYFVFFLVFIFGVPLMAYVAYISPKIRGLLLTALLFSTALGDLANINFISMENYRGPDRGFEVNLTDLFTLSLIAVILVGYPSKVRWFPYNSMWMFAFFVIACISATVAPLKLLAAFTLFKLVKAYILYWCIVNTFRTGVSLKYFWLSLVSIGAFITVIAIKQKYVDGIYRIPGPFDHSNTIPLYINMLMPILLIWGLADKAMKKWEVNASILLALGMVFAVVATSSRAGQAFAGISLLTTLAVANYRAKSLRVSAISVLLLMLIFIGSIKAADTIIHRVKSAPISSEMARDEFNIAADKMAHDNIFGVGLNNFSHVLTITPKYNEHIEVMKNEEQAGVAHHIYLLTAAEMGYAGLLVFLVIIARFVFIAFRFFRSSKSIEGSLAFGIGLGFCALHASGFLEWALRITPVTYMFTIICGVLVSIAKYETILEKPETV